MSTTNKPDLFRLVKEFWITYYGSNISYSETTLYYYLVEVCNQGRWENPFRVSSGSIMQSLRMSKSTYRTAIKNLQGHGLIRFEKGEGAKNYTLFELLKGVKNNTLSDDLESGKVPEKVSEKVSEKGSEINLFNPLNSNNGDDFRDSKNNNKNNNNNNKDKEKSVKKEIATGEVSPAPPLHNNNESIIKNAFDNFFSDKNHDDIIEVYGFQENYKAFAKIKAKQAWEDNKQEWVKKYNDSKESGSEIDLMLFESVIPEMDLINIQCKILDEFREKIESLKKKTDKQRNQHNNNQGGGEKFCTGNPKMPYLSTKPSKI